MNLPAKKYILAFLIISQASFTEMFAEQNVSNSSEESQTPSKPFDAFTGKITKNKVRMRQQPTLDAPVIREMKQNDLVIVVGETDDFFAVQPPEDVKAYVFRTYVLDNVVEANRVNVRLEPDVDAPTIAQLSAGDRVNGVISTRNNKWLEISPPSSTRFYIAKDYIHKLGDASLLSVLERQRSEVNFLLKSTDAASEAEMNKNFPDINLDQIYTNYNKIITSYSQFPEQTTRAREQVKMLQETYLQRKLAFLEDKSKSAHSDWLSRNSELNEQVKKQQQKLAQLEQQLTVKAKANNIRYNQVPGAMNNKMAAWLPAEEALYNEWKTKNEEFLAIEELDDDGLPELNLNLFYEAQKNESILLSGIIEPYTRVIKNKPGDYILVDPITNLPIAFLYSTTVNLQDKVGHNVQVYVAPRNNNNFAYPAYFVLSVE